MQILQSLIGLSGRSAENPEHTFLDGWESGNASHTGVRMTASRALEYAPVWQAVSMISGDIAGLPLEVMKRDTEDGRAADKGHAAYALIARKSNEEMTAFFFWRTIMTHLLIWNRAYAYIIRDQNSRPLELIPLLPDRTEAKRAGGVLQYQTELNGQMRTLRAANVLHLKGICSDGLDGCDLVTKARNSWSMGLAAEKFGAKFFKNGMRVSGVLQYPGKLKAAGKENLESTFNAKYAGLDNVARVLLLEENAKFVPTTIKPDEAQFNQTREEQVREVARWYNIDPSLLGVSGSVSYNSKEEANRAYWQSGLMPWSNTIRWECWTKLLTEDEKKFDSHIVQHNTMALLAGDIKTQAEVEEIWHRLGTRTANQIARSHNLAPVSDGTGDRYFITQNVQPADTPAAVPAAVPAGERLQDFDRSAVVDAAKKVLRESVQRVTNRIGYQARKYAKQPPKFCEWLDSGLADQQLANIIRSSAATVAAATDSDLSAQELVDGLVFQVRDSLNRVIDSVSADELPAAVEEAMRILEERLPAEIGQGATRDEHAE